MSDRLKWPPILEHAAEIVLSYDTGVTLRQLFYRLVADETLPNTRSYYNQLSSRTTKARRYDDFPALMDRTRRIHRADFSRSVEETLDRLLDHVRDRTEGQDYAVYVGTEKDALSAQLEQTFDEYGIPVLVMRGWHSEGYERVLNHDLASQRRASVLLYAGDLDPAGEGIEANIRKHIGFDKLIRVALDLVQVQEHRLPENTDPEVAAKLHRSPGRYAFEARYGRLFQVEVDALPPDLLRDLFLSELEPFLDRSIYEAVLEREARDQRALSHFRDQWEGKENQ